MQKIQKKINFRGIGIPKNSQCYLSPNRVPLVTLQKIMTEFLADVKFARDQETEAEMLELFSKLEKYKDDMQQITNPIANDLAEIVELLKNIYKQVSEAGFKIKMIK